MTADTKRYEELELEVVRFDAEDIVATSGGGFNPMPIGNCTELIGHFCPQDGVCFFGGGALR